MGVRKVLQKGIAITGATIIAFGMSFTAFAADAIDSVNGTQDPTAVPQQAQNSTIGYNVRSGWLTSNSSGFNVYGVGENGEYIQSTYNDSAYNTYVNNSGNPINSGNFTYGQEYVTQGLGTTITPTLTDESVILDYTLRNASDQQQNFRVGSSADTMIGNDDHAIIYGDSNAFTMTNGTTAIQISSPDTFDNLWYGHYSDVNSHFAENGIRTDVLQNVDSGVTWGWDVNLAPGQTAHRTAGAMIGAHERIISTQTEEKEVDQGWGPGPEKAPDIWFALTEAGNALPISAMGKASAKTYTMFANISGCSYDQIREAMKTSFAAAPAGGAFVYGTTEVAVIDRSIAETLSSRSDVSISIVYSQKGQQFQVNIPAGTDFKSLLDENGYCGFLKLASQFGANAIG